MSFININLPDTEFSYNIGDIVYYYFNGKDHKAIGVGEVKSIDLDKQEVDIEGSKVPIDSGYLFTMDKVIGETWLQYAKKMYEDWNKKYPDNPDSLVFVNK